MKVFSVLLLCAAISLTFAAEGSALKKNQMVYLPATIKFSYVLPENFPAALLGPDASCSAWLCNWSYHPCDPVQVISIEKRKSLITVDLPVGEKYKEVGMKRVGLPFSLSGDWKKVLSAKLDTCQKHVGSLELVEIESSRKKGYHLGFRKGWEIFQGQFDVRVLEDH